MPTLDDERFESYLKQFRPIVPDVTRLIEHQQKSHRPVLRLWAIGFATIVILGAVTFRIVVSRTTQKRSNISSVQVAQPIQPLTMRDANALLATAPSYKAAVDGMAFRNHGSTIAKGKQSALAVLAKEKIKL